jgi:glycosyltransferase involved in cell wall biosynthesis
MIKEAFLEKEKYSMKISFISHSAALGGAERGLLDIIDAVREKGVFVHVVIPKSGPLEEELLKRGVVFEVSDLFWWANVEKDNIKDAQNLIYRNALELVLKLKNVNPDIVFTSTSVISEGAIAAKILSVPHVWNVSEFGTEEHGIRYMLDEKERMEFVDKYSDKIFFVSDALKKYYEKRLDRKKMTVIPNMVKIKKSAIRQEIFFHLGDALKLALVGNVTKGKGQKDAILAVCDLLKKDKKVELVMAGTIGSREYYDELQKIIQENELEDYIKYVGCLESAAELIDQADVALVCSTQEGFGRVAVEGMLSRKPVILSNSGALPELVVEKENGFLYTPGDFNELAEKIEYFIGNRNEIERMGQNGYDFAKTKFNEEEYSKKIIKEFMELKKERVELVLSNEAIKEIVQNIDETKKEISEMREEMELMKTSKFWKLRNSYMKIKNIFK